MNTLMYPCSPYSKSFLSVVSINLYWSHFLHNIPNRVNSVMIINRFYNKSITCNISIAQNDVSISRFQFNENGQFWLHCNYFSCNQWSFSYYLKWLTENTNKVNDNDKTSSFPHLHKSYSATFCTLVHTSNFIIFPKDHCLKKIRYILVTNIKSLNTRPPHCIFYINVEVAKVHVTNQTTKYCKIFLMLLN